jgi:hypothetical protein
VAWKRPVLILSSMMVRKLTEVPEVVEDCLSCRRLSEETFALLPPTPSLRVQPPKGYATTLSRREEYPPVLSLVTVWVQRNTKATAVRHAIRNGSPMLAARASV